MYAVAPFLRLPGLSQALGLLGAAGVLAFMRWRLAYQGVTIEYPGSDTYVYQCAIRGPNWLGRSADRSSAGWLAALVLIVLCAGNLAMQTSLDENTWSAQTTKVLHTLAQANASEQAKLAQLSRLEHSLDPELDPAFGVVPDIAISTLDATPWSVGDCVTLSSGDGLVCSNKSQVARAVTWVVATLSDQKAAYKTLASSR